MSTYYDIIYVRIWAQNQGGTIFQPKLKLLHQKVMDICAKFQIKPDDASSSIANTTMHYGVTPTNEALKVVDSNLNKK